MQEVLKWFREISAIPRGSGNEDAVSAWLEAFARARGLEAVRDEAYNVIIKKPGQNGGELSPVVILQGHSDMVCEKLPGSAHDFMRDAIVPQEQDGWLCAQGTTLGADNGLGVAFILALLDSSTLRHPPIEAVITSGEEVGMVGMNALDPAVLTAGRMINLDAEEEGVLIASCAGGVRSELTLPITRQASAMGERFTLRLEGLAGGHSGVDIHRGRANVILLLGRLTEHMIAAYGIAPAGLTGGSKANTIPNGGSLTFYVESNIAAKIAADLPGLCEILKAELVAADRDFTLVLGGGGPELMPLDAGSLRTLLDCIALLPHGTMAFHESLPGQVSLSSNPGILEMGADSARIQSLSRGNIDSQLAQVVARLEGLARLTGGRLETGSGYGAWAYTPESPLRQLCRETYQALEGREMAVSSIHGGLECALMGIKMPGLDMISLGPNLLDVHTPKERVELASAQRFWHFLSGLLARM